MSQKSTKQVKGSKTTKKSYYVRKNKKCTCKFIFKKGPNKGKKCGKNCYDDFCKDHKKKKINNTKLIVCKNRDKKFFDKVNNILSLNYEADDEQLTFSYLTKSNLLSKVYNHKMSLDEFNNNIERTFIIQNKINSILREYYCLKYFHDLHNSNKSYVTFITSHYELNRNIYVNELNNIKHKYSKLFNGDAFIIPDSNNKLLMDDEYVSLLCNLKKELYDNVFKKKTDSIAQRYEDKEILLIRYHNYSAMYNRLIGLMISRRTLIKTYCELNNIKLNNIKYYDIIFPKSSRLINFLVSKIYYDDPFNSPPMYENGMLTLSYKNYPDELKPCNLHLNSNLIKLRTVLIFNKDVRKYFYNNYKNDMIKLEELNKNKNEKKIENKVKVPIVREITKNEKKIINKINKEEEERLERIKKYEEEERKAIERRDKLYEKIRKQVEKEQKQINVESEEEEDEVIQEVEFLDDTEEEIINNNNDNESESSLEITDDECNLFITNKL